MVLQLLTAFSSILAALVANFNEGIAAILTRWLTVFGAGAATIVAAPVVAGATLNAVGFTAGGVAAGSVAAGVQSAVYGGATSGAFAALQSAGALGISTSVSYLAGAAASLGAWWGTQGGSGV